MFLTSQPEEMLIKADKKHGPSLSFHHFIIPQYIYIYIYNQLFVSSAECLIFRAFVFGVEEIF